MLHFSANSIPPPQCHEEAPRSPIVGVAGFQDTLLIPKSNIRLAKAKNLNTADFIPLHNFAAKRCIWIINIRTNHLAHLKKLAKNNRGTNSAAPYMLQIFEVETWPSPKNYKVSI